MNGKQLKNSILQWAIQGKLVPQDPNDEPASVLLERIRAEKARLVKEGKIKKDKNESIIFRGDDNSHYEKFLATGEVKCIDEEIPFEIPKGWEWERIGNIFETTSGSTPLSRNPDYYKDGGINWVRTTDLNNGTLSKAEIQITAKACSDYNLTILPQNSVCIAMYGGAGTIGKHSILHLDTTINQSVCAILPNGYCAMEYVHTFIEYQRPYWMDFATGSRKDPNINQLIIKHCLLPVPPKKEQLRIVEKLGLLSPHINRYGECQTKLDNINKEILNLLKKSILQEAIQGKLVPQDPSDEPASELLKRIREEKQKLIKEGKLKKKDITDSIIFRGADNRHYEKIGGEIVDISEDIPFDIPDSWSWVRLRNLCSIMTGATFRKEDARHDEQGIRVLRGGNVLPFEIRFKGDDIFLSPDCIKHDILLKQNDLITPAVTSLENICKMARIEKDMPTTTVGGFVFILRPYYDSDSISIYLLEALSSPALIEFVKSITNKSGQAFYNIGKERLGSALIPLPPIKEQKRINDRIELLWDNLR